MRKYPVAFICVLILMLAARPISDFPVMAAENGSGSIQEIGNDLEQYVNDHADTTAGMSVAVFDKNGTIYRNSFGYMDVENKIPVAEDTVMEWGSVSKLLVWISVMQLSEQGLIDLKADIDTYLPDGFLQNRTYDTPITMLNLMNHNAGFEEHVIGMATGKEDRIIPLEEYLLNFQPRQVFEPGSVCAYSNWGTSLAAYIVERISGVPYHEYVHTNIFEPLQMKDASICADFSDNPSVKERRTDLKIYTTEVKEITPNLSYIIMYPAGSCVSTIGDMQKFAQSLLSEDTVLFRDKETWHSLFSPSLCFEGTETPKNYHGFWALESFGTNVIGHSGNTAGCSSGLLLDIENQVGMVIQTNQNSEQLYNSEMPKLLFGEYQGTASGYTGLVMSARTIFQGPLKLYRLFSVTNFIAEEPAVSYDVRTNDHDIDRISCTYGDYLVIGIRDIAGDIIVLGLYLISLVYCLINIVRSFILKLLSKIKGKEDRKVLGFWCALGSLIPFVPVFIFAVMIPTLFNFQQWSVSAYRAALALILLSGLIMLALIIFGYSKLRTGDLKKSRKIYIHSINICLAVTVVNIVYWNWFMFWMI